MKRFLSLLLTFTLILSVFSTLGVVVHAVETEPEQDGGSSAAELIVLPEFTFPTNTETELSAYNLPLDEIKALFPEEAETKYEDGIYYIKDIGAASASVLNYFNYERYDMTLVDGYWTVALTEEEAAGDLSVQFIGAYWLINYINGQRNRMLQLYTEYNSKYINIYYEDDLCSVYYNIGQDIGVENEYSNGVLTSHMVSKNTDDGFLDIYYNPDKSVNYVELYVRSVGDYHYLLDEGWSEYTDEYVPTDAPEGYEDYTFNDFAELAPHDFDGNIPRNVAITGVSLIVDGVEYTDSCATVYANSEVLLKVYGENLDYATNDQRIKHAGAYNEWMGPGYMSYWDVDANGFYATCKVNVNTFIYTTEEFVLKYTNDGGTTWEEAEVSVIYENNCRNDEHNLRDEQTCMGYQCGDCFKYFGEGNGVHTDGGDGHINMCDNCQKYTPTIEVNVALGENTVSLIDHKYIFVPFVPNEGGVYRFYSLADGYDPKLTVYNADMNLIGSNDDANGLDFSVDIALEKGKTYYLAFYNYDEDFDCTVMVELLHSHDDLEQTCMGYYCPECNKFYGEEGGDHDTSGGQTCIGYYCKWCEEYYGEASDHDTSGGQTCLGYYCKWCDEYYGEKNEKHDLGDEQTCIGYQCRDCFKYFGEGNGVHTDGEDSLINCCDVCGVYVPTVEVTVALGENTVSLVIGKYIFVPFVPSESGVYRFYSLADGYDPMLTVYDADMNEIGYSDDDDGTNFSLDIDLVKGKTYYLAFYNYSVDFDCAVTVEFLHSHKNLEEQTCKGYYCPECDEYVGEAGDHDTTGGQTCIGYYCKWCDEYYGEGNDKHSDGKDDSVNRCDHCGEYCADNDLKLGESVIFVGMYVDKDGEEYGNCAYIRFVPTVSGEYLICSASDGSDPRLIIYDSEWDQIVKADDENGYDFRLLIELEAGKTYYFEFYDFVPPAEYTVTVELHEHDYVLTCIGYVCDGCGDCYGEPGEEHRLQDTQTCHGYLCRDCGEWFGEADPDAHLWYFGYCYFCGPKVEYPEDLPCDHIWYDGDCGICGEDHDCTPENYGDTGRCEYCDDKAGCSVTTNGVTKYYKGFTAALAAAVDGSVITLRENRYSTKEYNIYKDITFDLNGYRFKGEDGVINVYANVTFMDSDAYLDGEMMAVINVYEKCNILSGFYGYDIVLHNGIKYSDIIYGCSYIEMYDEDKGWITLSSIELDEMGYLSHFYLWNDDSNHVFVDFNKDATCTENAFVVTACIYCGEIEETREFENTATGHISWSGNYGEGTKSCNDCGLTIPSKIYSGDAARAVSAAVTRTVAQTAYEIVTDFVVDMFEKYLGWVIEGVSEYVNR